LNPKPIEDWTIEAQKFLSCVARCRERFGMVHIIDVLRGSRKQKIEQNGHHLLSTYGIGKDKTADEWKMLARSLLHQGLLDETTDGYRVLKLNKSSWEILRKQRNVSIAVNRKTADKLLPNYNPKAAEIEMLFDRLRDLRKHIADAQSIAPYVIFADSSLKLMAQLQPQTLEAFAKISGVNNYKLKQYGDRFVSEIRSFCQQQKLPESVPSSTQMVTFGFYNQGLSVEEIAEKRSLKQSTIYDHLSQLISMRQPIDINKFVLAVRQEIIVKAIETVGTNSLKDIKEHLGENYNYNEIKLVRAWWQKNNN